MDNNDTRPVKNMASQYFNFSKTGGTGGYLAEEVVVTPVAVNTTSGDNVCIATVQGGGRSWPVTITHFGVPAIRLVSGSTSVPANGDTLYYEIDTHYPFCFKNVPAFVTISDSNGRTYVADTQYADTLAEGTTFYIQVGANTGVTTRTSGSFYMGHYYPDANGTLSTTYTAPITFSQAAGATAAISLSPSTIVFDWDDETGDTKTITVTSTVSWTASLPSNSHYEIVGSATGASGTGTIVLQPKTANGTSSNKYNDTLTVTGVGVTATATLTHYRQPVINALTGSGQINIPATGGSLDISITSDYNWWFEQKSGQYQDPAFSTAYMELTDNGTVVTPPLSSSSPALAVPNGKTYGVTWTLNNGVPRNDSLNVKYAKLGGGTADASTNISRVHQDYVVVPSISIDPSTLVFDWWEGTGDTRSIYVSTNQGSWDYEVGHNIGDFTFTKDGNYLRITPTGTHTSTLPGVAKRYATLNFSAGTATATGRTEQYRKPSINPATGASREIPASGGTRELLITSDYDWWVVTQFETNSYLTVEKGGTQVSVFDPNSPYGPVSYEGFDFIWDENQTGDERPPLGQACFEMRYKNRSGGTRTDGGSDCGWKQSAATVPVVYTISVSPTGASVSSGANMLYTAEVTASNDWSLSTDVDWLRWYSESLGRTPMTGGTSGTTTIYRRIDENSGSSRTGTTTFTCGTASTTYVVQQAAGYVAPSWAASPDSFDEPSQTSQTLEVTITAATGWTTQKGGDFDGDWINILQATGTAGVSTLYFYITQNSSGAPRSGWIKIISPTEGYITKLTILIDQDYP